MPIPPRLPVGDGDRASSAAVVGALNAIAVQRALRHDHPLAGQQIPDLDHRQTLPDPAFDLIVVGAQRFPRHTMALRTVWADRGHHRADQLVAELADATLTIQLRRYRSIDVAPRLMPQRHLPIHSGPPHRMTWQ
jgi:hypothetical protein